MEAANAQVEREAPRLPAWLAGLLPLAVLGVAIGLFVALGAPGLERNGIPVEELSFERTVLQPGEIELHVRNDGPDPVEIRQVTVNDAFSNFSQTDDEIGRLQGGHDHGRLPVDRGGGLRGRAGDQHRRHDHALDRRRRRDAGGRPRLLRADGAGRALRGRDPVGIGMLWLPWVRRIDPRWVQFLLALTLGLLGFLGDRRAARGHGLRRAAARRPSAARCSCGAGAAIAYLGLMGVDARLRERRDGSSAGPWRLALLVALGIGLHNLGEGLAIGSAYAIGSLALGATLIVGFALHNTTEGLAIVAPVARDEESSPGDRSLRRLAWLGLIAGAPAVLGAWIGASAFNPSLAAFLFGLGAGAIAQVIVQIAPSVRDKAGRLLHPLAVAGILTGLVFMYATSLLVSL